MAKNVVDIKFGVAGGSSTTEGSGLLIKKQLEAIASKIKLKITIDRSYFSQQLSSLQKEIQKKLGKLNINVNATGTPKTTDGTSSKSNTASTSEQNKQYAELKQNLADIKTAAKKTFSSAQADARTLDKALADTNAKLNEFNTTQRSLAGDNKITQSQSDSLATLSEQLRRNTQEWRENAEARRQNALIKLQNGYDKFDARVQSVGERYSDIIKTNKEAKGLFDSLIRVRDAYKQALDSGDLDLANQKFTLLRSKISSTEAELSRMTVAADTLGKKLLTTMGNKVLQSIAYALIAAVVRALRQVYDNVVKIDEAMTQLKIVTDASIKSYEKFGKTAARVAQQIGASLTDLIDSTTTFARLGYGLDDAAILAEKTTIYSKVASVDVNEATKNITAIVKAFGIEASQLESVIDQLIYVGNNYAISQAEIGEAMNNAASALAANGNTLQEAIGIVTAANVTLQNISKSSTAVRTIAARISASTAQLEELGEETTDIMSTADLAERMGAFGVSILNANGELRSTYDILSDLSKQWEHLTSVERAAIAEMLAGTRQQSAFYSIMQNWQDAASIVQNTADAYGSMQKAQEEYLNSIQGKSAQLKATWEEFSQNVLNSDFVKALIDILNALGQVLNFLTSIGDGTLLQAGFIAILTVAIGKLIEKLNALAVSARTSKAGLVDLGLGAQSAFKSIANSTTSMVAAFALLTLCTQLFDEFGETAGAAGKIIVGAIAAVTAAILAFESSNPIGWIALAISGVIMLIQGISDLIHANSLDGLKEKAEEAKEAWDELNNTLDETKDKLADIDKQIEELEKKGDSITLVDRRQLQYLKQARTELLKLQEEQQRQADAAAAESAKAAKDALDRVKGQKKNSQEDNVGWAIVVGIATLGIGNGIWAAVDAAKDEQHEIVDEIFKEWDEANEDERQRVQDYINQYNEIVGGYEYQVPEIDENGNRKELQQWQKDINEMLDEYYTLQDKMSVATGNIALAWDSAFSRVKYSSGTEALSKLANNLNVTEETLRNLYNDDTSVKAFLDYLQDIGLFAWDDQEKIEGLVNQIRALRNNQKVVAKRGYIGVLEGMQEEYDLILNALDDMKEVGIVSRETIEELINDYPELMKSLQELGVIQETDTGYTVSENALDAWIDKRRAAYKKALEEAQAFYEKELAAYNNGTLTDADLQAAEASLNNAIENLEQFEVVVATLGRSKAIEEFTKQLEDQQDALEDQLDKYEELIDIRKDLLETYKEEVDYQKELASRQQKVADLQTQLAVARLDRSASGQARARELEADLQSAQEDLEDYTLDKAIDDLTAKLDDDLSEYEKFIQEQIDIIAEKLDNIVKAYNEEYGEPKVLGVEEHHSGGFVGNKTTLSSNERFAKLLNGEFVSTPAQMDRFIKHTLPWLQSAGNGSAIINNNSPLIQIRCGSIDKDTMPELENFVDKAVQEVEKRMESALSRTGYKKQF